MRQSIPNIWACDSTPDVDAEAVASASGDVSTEYPIIGARDWVSLLKKAAEPVMDADTGCRRL